jgi:hypothetical protein
MSHGAIARPLSCFAEKAKKRCFLLRPPRSGPGERNASDGGLELYFPLIFRDPCPQTTSGFIVGAL